MPPLPMPFRVALGLVATARQEAKNLPDKVIELPMLAVSTALQLSLRAQQRYAHLAAKGDELLAGRSTTDEPPPWATFDAPVEFPGPDAPRGRSAIRRPRNGKNSAFDAIDDEWPAT